MNGDKKPEQKWCSYELSGSELALRVAVCDLVQRLKRCEHTCKYLEQCRNELARECIKLRHDNHLMSRQINQYYSTGASLPMAPKSILGDSDQGLQSHSLPQAGKQAIDYRLGEQKDYGLETDMNEKQHTESIRDESWEEITIRLIKELKKEMIGAYTGQRSISDLPAEPNPVTQLDVPMDARVQPININEVGVRNYIAEIEFQKPSPLETLINRTSKQNEAKMKNVIRVKGARNSIVEKDHTHAEEMLDILSHSDYKEMKMREVRGSSQEVEHCSTLFADEHFKEAVTRDKSEPLTIFFTRVLRAVNADLDRASKGMAKQNENLVRLKSRQIRNYFRRQLDGSAHASKCDLPKGNLEHV